MNYKVRAILLYTFQLCNANLYFCSFQPWLELLLDIKSLVLKRLKVWTKLTSVCLQERMPCHHPVVMMVHTLLAVLPNLEIFQLQDSHCSRIVVNVSVYVILRVCHMPLCRPPCKEPTIFRHYFPPPPSDLNQLIW